MRQLVQLKKSEERFQEMGVEVIAVFREEQNGVEGLKKIKRSTEVPFTLCLDTGAEQTAKYSPGRREFDNYVIDQSGNIAAKIDGDLRNRATSEQLFTVLEGLTGEAEEAEAEEGSGTKPGSETKGSETKGSETKPGSTSR